MFHERYQCLTVSIQGEAVRTVADEAPLGVEAGAAPAEAGVQRTLVDVLARLAVSARGAGRAAAAVLHCTSHFTSLDKLRASSM